MRVHHLSWWFALLEFLTLDASPLLVTFNLHNISARSLKGGKDLWHKLDGEHYMHVLCNLKCISSPEDILERVLVLLTFQVLFFGLLLPKMLKTFWCWPPRVIIFSPVSWFLWHISSESMDHFGCLSSSSQPHTGCPENTWFTLGNDLVHF